MTYLVSVSKSGYNALTTTNINNFIFNSLYNTFKIIASATYSPTLPPSSSEAFTSIAHNQSYIPFVVAFCKFSNNRVGFIGCKDSSSAFYFTNLRVDNTYISFGYINDTGGNYTPVWRYYIFEVPL